VFGTRAENPAINPPKITPVSPDQESLKNPNKLFAPVCLKIRNLLCAECLPKIEAVDSGVVPFESISFDKLCSVCLPKVQAYVADAKPIGTWTPAPKLNHLVGPFEQSWKTEATKPWPLWLWLLYAGVIFLFGFTTTWFLVKRYLP
jgi:hypothetical protein